MPADCSRNTKRSGAAVHDRHFAGADFDQGIVDAETRERRQQVLDGRDLGLALYCSVVPIMVSPTFSACARMSTGCRRSVRRNTMPVSGAAGRRVIRTFLPVCRPTPVARIEFSVFVGSALSRHRYL